MKTLTRIFLIAALLLPLGAFAQTAQTRASLYSEIDAQLPTNGSGAITAAVLRNVLKDVVASHQNGLTDGTALTVTGSYANPAAITSLAVSKLTQSGATTGQALLWNGTAWAPGTVIGSGDMLKSTYDVDGNGVIDIAALPTPLSGNASSAQVVRGNDPRLTDARTPATGTIPDKIAFGWDGGGTTLTSSATTVEIPIPYACTVTGWQIAAKPSGSITVVVKKATPSGGSYTLTTIDGGTGPSTSSAQFSASTSLGSWTATTFAAGDVVSFSITGSPTVTYAAGLLKVLR